MVTIVAALVAVFPPVPALLLSDLYLGNKQDAMGDSDLGGEKAQPSS